MSMDRVTGELPATTEKVILVNASDSPIGEAEKLQAHLKADLHRAFSVFGFSATGEMLLQRRALGKYHSGGLWTNLCCGHPRPGEALPAAAARRLSEEMGLDAGIVPVRSLHYRTEVGGGLTENEIAHLCVCQISSDPRPCASEVMDWRWASLSEVDEDIRQRPDRYTEWLKLYLAEVPGLLRDLYERSRIIV